MTIWDTTFRLALAFALGMIVGYERGSLHRPAGMRTHALICMGSALAMVLGELMLDRYGDSSTDPTRLGAQVISGIGFICAGTIINRGLTVKGLTTAAGLWAVALIGLVVGAGYWAPGTLAAALVFFAMTVLRKIENKRIKFRENVMLLITAEQKPSIIGDISSVLASAGIPIRTINVDEKPDGLTVRVQIRMNREVSPELIAEQIDEIVGVGSVMIMNI